MQEKKENYLDPLRSEGEFSEKVLSVLGPLFNEYKELKLTVRIHRPHWLKDIQGAYDDRGVQARYQRIHSLIIGVLPEVEDAIEKEDTVLLNKVAVELFSANTDKERYGIYLGSETNLISTGVVNALSERCAKNMYEPDFKDTQEKVVNALTNVVRRMRLYIDESV